MGSLAAARLIPVGFFHLYQLLWKRAKEKPVSALVFELQ